ncbi:MAG: hypothetical protein AB7F22_12805 [Reyranella sp.]|uniref:hypothetical protein n=1 Tax=Reyranella sp. TaxID=1929291 RepID=UPI003D13C3BE
MRRQKKANSRQDVVARRVPQRKTCQPIGRLADCHHPLRGMVQGFLGILAEGPIALEQAAEDQVEVAFGVGREFNREPHAPGVYD